MSDTRPTDLISQREAAALVGRGVDTIRRWRREKGLEVYRDDLPSSPAMVSRAQILAIAGSVSKASNQGDDKPPVKGSAIASATPEAILAHREHIRTLQGQVVSMEAQIAFLQEKLREQDTRTQKAEAVAQQLRADLADKDRRIQSLEAELASPVRALLGAGRRRLFG